MKENQLADGIPPKLETKALMAVEARVGEKRKGEDYYRGVCFKCGYPMTSNHWSKHCTNKRVKPGFVPLYGYQSTGAGDRASKWQRQREAGRGRGGRVPGGRGPGGRRPFQPKLMLCMRRSWSRPSQDQARTPSPSPMTSWPG
jgi:hypothetical protein